MNSASTEESNQICAHNSQGAIIEDSEVEHRILKMLGDLGEDTYAYLIVKISGRTKLRKKADTIIIEGRNSVDICFVDTSACVKGRDRSAYSQAAEYKEDEEELRVLHLTIPTHQQITVYERRTAVRYA